MQTGYPSIDKPWLKFYPREAFDYQIPACSIYDYMIECSSKYQKDVAIEYLGITITYEKMYKEIDKAAKALKSVGVCEHEIVSVCLPNVPEVVYVFYAINKIGAVANMLDPRSNEDALKDALYEAKSKLLITLDSAAEKFSHILNGTQASI